MTVSPVYLDERTVGRKRSPDYCFVTLTGDCAQVHRHGSMEGAEEARKSILKGRGVKRYTRRTVTV